MQIFQHPWAQKMLPSWWKVVGSTLLQANRGLIDLNLLFAFLEHQRYTYKRPMQSEAQQVGPRWAPRHL